jgi:hypothetical protein
MALKFNCDHCGNEIVVQYLRIGETAICRHCGKKSEVPADAQGEENLSGERLYNLGSLAIGRKQIPISAEMLENIDASRAYSLESSARAVTILLWISVAVLTVFSISGIIQYWILVKMKNGTMEISSTWGAASDSLDSLIALFYIVCGLGTLIAFFVWFYRAHRNLRYANVPGIRHASGWTIGGFFVPILNFFRPYQMMDETWRGSAVMAGTHTHEKFLLKPANAKIILWWLFAILAGITSFIGSEAVRYSETIDGIIAGIIISVLGRMGYALFFVMLIYLVREITQHQSNARKIAMVKSSA